MALAVEAPPVSIVGNLTIDLIVHGVDALPVWGREVAGHDHQSVASGQAAYLALGLARLGVASRLVGIVGDDSEGETIRAELAAAGVATNAIETSAAAPTAITVAIVRTDGERAFVSDFACQRFLDAELVNRHWTAVATARALCLVGLFNLPGLPPETAAPLFARARAAGLKTVLDTGWDPGEWSPETVAGTLRLLAETDLFLPNREEAEALTGLADAAEAAEALVRAGADVVVVKCGPDGSVGRTVGQTVQVPAYEIAVHDAVGAGDSFDAGFLCAYLEGRGLHECMQFATATAATYVSRAHDRYPSVGDVEAAMTLERKGSGPA
jgi:sugar/nucleoside kinase (ribokinase family)